MRCPCGPDHCPLRARGPRVDPARCHGRDFGFLWPVSPRAARLGRAGLVGAPGRLVGAGRPVPAHHAGAGRPRGPLRLGRRRGDGRASVAFDRVRRHAPAGRPRHPRGVRRRRAARRGVPRRGRDSYRGPRPGGSAPGHSGLPLAPVLLPPLHDGPAGRNPPDRVRPAGEPARAHRRDGRVRRYDLRYVHEARRRTHGLHPRGVHDPRPPRGRLPRDRDDERPVRPVGAGDRQRFGDRVHG